MMFRILRAFAWMRWRVLLNSLERTGARDTLERLSLAVEQIGPLIGLALFVPSAVALAGLGGYAGYWMAGGGPVRTFEALRILLLAACGLSIIGPLMMPSMEPTAIVRLLLLPIPRATLYAAQIAGALSEPWIILSLPIVFAVPLGLALGGAFLPGIVALVAAVLFVLCLIGLSTLSTLLLHLLVRDRRRGELLALLFILVVPAISMVPALLASRSHRSPAADHGMARGVSMPGWVERTAGVAYALVPGQLFSRAIRSSVAGEAGGVIFPLLVLVSASAVLHTVGLFTFLRLLDSPSAGTRRQPASQSQSTGLRLPFLSRATAAVAQAQLRLAMRTPRGRSILLGPFIVFVILWGVLYQQGAMHFGGFSFANGLSLATIVCAMSLLSLQPFAMNQFAIDRSGLTLALLAPIETRELLAGKTVGLGLTAGGPVSICLLAAFIFIPGGAPELWMTLPLAFVATYLLFAPGAATLSALFPRTVDLNSVGRRSNPHGFASVLGLFLFVASTLPSLFIVFVTTNLLHRPALTPFIMLTWCGVALVLSRALFGGVAVLFDRRRENLGIVAS